MAIKFCLVHEPWVPCYREQVCEDLPLREVLLKAHQIQEVVDPSPLVTSALFRFLLCVVHRVVDGPQNAGEWKSLWKRGRFDPNTVDGYLGQWENRFDLFHPEHPFFQVEGLSFEEPKTVANLSKDLAVGTWGTLYDHSMDDDPQGRSPAWCARSLLALQAWALMGGRGSRSTLGLHPYACDAPLAGKMQFFLQRRNLFETLMANLLIPESLGHAWPNEEDRPVWEQDEVRPLTEGKVYPKGYLDYLTFPARYVRLLPIEEGGKTVVKEVHIGQGACHAPDLLDPFTSWCEGKDPDTGKVKILPHSLQVPKDASTYRDPWRDAQALCIAPSTEKGKEGQIPANLRQASTPDFSPFLEDEPLLRVRSFGVAKNQAVMLCWSMLDLPFSATLLHQREHAEIFRDTLERIEKGWWVLRKASKKALQEVYPEDKKRVDFLRKKLPSGVLFWSRMTEGFEVFMRHLETDPEEARREWLGFMKEAALASIEEVVDSLPGNVAKRLRAMAKASSDLNRSMGIVWKGLGKEGKGA